jgi:hypothetical protein
VEDGKWKGEYTYDTNGNMIEHIGYRWNFTMNKWVERYKYEYEYDTNKNLIMYVEKEAYWYDSIPSWRELNKFEYEYDTNGNLIMYVEKKLFGITPSWHEYQKYEYEYDNMNNRTTSVFYTLFGGVWRENSKMEFEHNLLYDLDDLILSNWGHTYYKQIAAKNMFTGEKSYEWNGTDWDTIYTEKWYYSEPKVNIIEPNKENIKVYPNPTTGKLIVDNGQLTIGNVEIYDIYGRKFSHFTIHVSPIEIDISHLSSGIYFLKIQTENGTVTKKVIKE